MSSETIQGWRRFEEPVHNNHALPTMKFVKRGVVINLALTRVFGFKKDDRYDVYISEDGASVGILRKGNGLYRIAFESGRGCNLQGVKLALEKMGVQRGGAWHPVIPKSSDEPIGFVVKAVATKPKEIVPIVRVEEKKAIAAVADVPAVVPSAVLDKIPPYKEPELAPRTSAISTADCTSGKADAIRKEKEFEARIKAILDANGGVKQCAGKDEPTMILSIINCIRRGTSETDVADDHRIDVARVRTIGVEFAPHIQQLNAFSKPSERNEYLRQLLERLKTGK